MDSSGNMNYSGNLYRNMNSSRNHASQNVKNLVRIIVVYCIRSNLDNFDAFYNNGI
jgi:hypothetical protein